MMRYFPALRFALVAALVVAPAARAQRAGRLCPDPARPCGSFRAHDLSFVLDRRPAARAEQHSDAFYGVILRSGRDCAIPERDRAAAQAAFPRRKVFSNRFQCDGDEENNVSYSGTSEHTAFLAVYAAPTRSEGAEFLRRVVASGRWPGANLRLLRVVLNYD